jgi:hypothetical protein
MANDKTTEKNKDALFRFAMSEDGMKLGVSRYFPPNGGAGPSVKLLMRQVANAGVNLPVDEQAAELIINSIRQTGEIKRIPLVRGIPVQEPCDASMVALGDLHWPVFPGDHFARKNPPTHAKAGQTIDGRTIKPKKNFEPSDMNIKLGENVEIDAITGDFVSLVWGMARYVDGIISVDPIPRISEDEITVTGTIHHKNFKGQDITPAQLEKEMRDLGVVIDIDSDKLDNTLKRAKIVGEPLYDHVIVHGAHPIPGHDGWFEYLVSSREDTGTEDEAGRLDFRNRGAYPMVTPGQIIGRLHAPTAGEGGIDIYGKTIPAHAGKELFIHQGEGTEADDDKVVYKAKVEGVVSMDKNTLSVTDCLLIKGDVDLTTGNVEVEKGSVKIMGSVQAGAVVSAPKHVIVAGSVESATITAGSNIEVNGGILMPEGGIARAEGDVTAGYTTNARIEAGRDVYISNDITNTVIHAGGTLYATEGKGHIQGGNIITAKGMEVNEIGSELGVETMVTVQVDDPDDNSLREQRAKIKASIDKINEAVGSDPAEMIIARTPDAKRPAIIEIIKHRNELIRKRKQLSEAIQKQMLAHQEELEGVQIKVKRFLYPGAVVKFGSKTFHVAKRTEASSIYWSQRARDIVFE